MIWRLIYTNSRVINLFETQDITLTPHLIFESETQEECFKKIDELKLTYYYYLNERELLLFSGGTRTIVENPI